MTDAVQPQPRLPYPWESAGFRNYDLARLARALFRRRRALANWYPDVVVPCSGFGFAYGSENLGPLLAGGLVRLWSRWPEFRGRCPDCTGSVVGLAGGGGLSSGHVTGVCRRCALVVTRHMGGFGSIVTGVNHALAGSAFTIGESGRRERTRDFGPLVAVLRELGEADLPAPDAIGLHGRPRDATGDLGEPW